MNLRMIGSVWNTTQPLGTPAGATQSSFECAASERKRAAVAALRLNQLSPSWSTADPRPLGINVLARSPSRIPRSAASKPYLPGHSALSRSGGVDQFSLESGGHG
jgi:hypothetical protein